MGTRLAEPKQSEIMSEIAAAWESAKAQLERLKVQVARAGELAELKGRRDDLQGARDKALRDLGAQAYELVRQGKLTLPGSAAAALKAVEAANRSLEAQAREINDLLKEGGEVADKLRAGKVGANSTVAAKPKKR
jgi:hypothetical protein